MDTVKMGEIKLRVKEEIRADHLKRFHLAGDECVAVGRSGEEWVVSYLYLDVEHSDVLEIELVHQKRFLDELEAGIECGELELLLPDEQRPPENAIKRKVWEIKGRRRAAKARKRREEIERMLSPS